MEKIGKNLEKLISESPEHYKLKKTFLNVLNYVQKADWMGACHATTAILYVLLQEQGYKVKACLGETSKPPIVFDHSWIELDGKVIDVAISNTLIKGLKFPPVCLGVDLISGQESELKYGINSGNGFDPQAKMISNMTLGSYMDAFPDHPDGLWGVLKKLAKMQGLRLNIGQAKKKWADDNWTVIN